MSYVHGDVLNSESHWFLLFERILLIFVSVTSLFLITLKLPTTTEQKMAEDDQVQYPSFEPELGMSVLWWIRGVSGLTRFEHSIHDCIHFVFGN